MSVLTPGESHAQLSLRSLGEPRMGPSPAYGFGLSFDSYLGTTHGSGLLSTNQTGLDGSATLCRTETARLAFSTRATHTSIATDTNLPLSGTSVPEKAIGVDAGLSWNNRRSTGRMDSVRLQIGSSSDAPFSDDNVTDYSLTFTTMDSPMDGSSWLFLLLAGSQLGELNRNAIPGFAYLKIGEKYQVLAGFPFSTVSWEATPKLWLNASYVPVTNFNVSASYAASETVSFKMGIDRQYSSYLLADTPADERRFAIYQTHAYVALSGCMGGSSRWEWEVSAGYAFDRQLYQGRGLNAPDSDGGTEDVADAVNLSLKLRLVGR